MADILFSSGILIGLYILIIVPFELMQKLAEKGEQDYDESKK